MHFLKSVLICCTLLIGAFWPLGALACPFCSATSQTLSEEIAAADVAVIARLIKLPPELDPSGDGPASLNLDNGPDSGLAEFEVLETVRGDDIRGAEAAKGSTIKVVYFGGDQQKKRFLISGIAGKRIDWSTPLPLTERGIEYIRALGKLPEQGPARLAFFLGHLEDEDPLLGQDAYDEFARAPYEVVIALRDRMDRLELLGWIEDSQIGPTRRRLYLTMLGICGQPADVEILESLINYDYQQMKPGIAAMLAIMGHAGPVVGVSVVNEMIRADVRRKQQCLDALIAAYLKLKGPAGLPLIERRFLTNPAAEYTHVYAAVMALRFHGEETDSLPRARLLESMRLLLNNTEIADQVIPDLARWDDWSILERLVTMFKDSEEDAWVRQPVISYLLAASEQPEDVGRRAKDALTELEKLDPQGVKRARSYMAFGLLARAGAKKKTPQPSDKTAKDKVASENQDSGNQAAGNQDTGNQDAGSAASRVATAAGKEADGSAAVALAKDNQTASIAAENPKELTSTPAIANENSTPPGPSRVMIIGGPLIAGLFLFGVFALLLRGADVRSSSNDS